MKKNFTFLVVLLVCYLHMSAQTVAKNVSHQSQIWVGYFNQTRFSNKWGMWTDVHLRTKENLADNFSQLMFRVGATYYIDNHTKLTAGYTYVNYYPADNHPTQTQVEHRPWQQLQWHTQYGKKRLGQWIRFEQRFRQKAIGGVLTNDYSFNYRVRYNFSYNIPLSKKGLVANTWSVVLNDEIHLNLGKEIVNNTFDQNRMFAGLAYQFTPQDIVQFGYMNIFQQQSGVNQYRSVDVLRLFYFQNLDLRSKKK